MFKYNIAGRDRQGAACWLRTMATSPYDVVYRPICAGYRLVAGRTLVYHADSDGNEFHQIYTIGVHGGWPEQRTRTPDAQYYIGDWSPNGSRLAYTVNDRWRDEMDVIVRDLASGETQQLITGGVFFFAGWAPDGQRLLAVQINSTSNTDTNIYLLAPGGAPRLLPPHEDEAVYFPVE